MDLAEFVKARLDEDEHVAKLARPEFFRVEVVGQFAAVGDVSHVLWWDPARILREVEAKRAILDHHKPVRHEGRSMCHSCLGTVSFWPCPTLQHLGAIWRDHPDYDPAWSLAT